MADTKITALAAIGANPINVATFPIPMVDLLDNSMAASGTTKKVTVNQILGAGGTATLASATISGDLTVDTSTLKVDSANDRVGIGTATPAAKLIVRDGTNRNLLVSSDAAQLGSAGIAIGSFTDNAAGYAPLSIIAGTSMAFGMNGSTAMTLDSTGLGVGVAPTQPLTVRSSVTAIGMFHSTNASGPYVIFQNSTGNFGDIGSELAITGGGSAGNLTLNSRSTSNLCFAVADSVKMRLDASGNLLVGTTSASAGAVFKVTGTVADSKSFEVFSTASSASSAFYCPGSGTVNGVAGGANSSGLIIVNKDSGNSRSISAAGTLNASGADYAEYMTKAGDFVLSKGGIAGIDANGKLTNVFADAVSFVVKSTDPSYVGNDKWGVGLEGDALESARQLVDRIAFAGQVPVNVTGAKAGDYIVPVVDGTGIKGIAISNPTFEQYQLAVGKVITIDADGRARIIVKVA